MISRIERCSAQPARMAAARGGPDPGHLSEPRRRLLDDLEHALAKGAREFSGIGGPDATDHSRPEILLDTLHGCWCGDLKDWRLELHAVRAVVEPLVGRLHELTRRDARRMADHA